MSRPGPDLLPTRQRLLVIDNRGVGKSDATWPPYSTARLADDVAAVMDHAGVARAHVFGMSLGGMIAQQLALRHPQRIDRLILGCTTPGGRSAHPTPVRSQRALVRAAFGDDEPVTALLLARPTAELRAWLSGLRRTETTHLRGFL